MTKAALLEILKDIPDDAEILAFNGDEGDMVPITGVCHGWNYEHKASWRYAGGPLREGEIKPNYIAEIHTDDVS